MKTFRLFLLALFAVLPFCEIDAAKIDIKVPIKNDPIIPRLPTPRRDNDDAPAYISQISSRDFYVYFYENIEDVTIEICDEDDCVIGEFHASEVLAGDIIVIKTTADGATELLLFADDTVIYSATF